MLANVYRVLGFQKWRVSRGFIHVLGNLTDRFLFLEG